MKCPVYSGTPLLWTPWGPGKVSYIERGPYFRGKCICRKSESMGMRLGSVWRSGNETRGA